MKRVFFYFITRNVKSTSTVDVWRPHPILLRSPARSVVCLFVLGRSAASFVHFLHYMRIAFNLFLLFLLILFYILHFSWILQSGNFSLISTVLLAFPFVVCIQWINFCADNWFIMLFSYSFDRQQPKRENQWNLNHIFCIESAEIAWMIHRMNISHSIV